MRNLIRTRKRAVLRGVVVGTIAAIATLSVAAWLQDSSGAGAGRIGQLQTVTLTAGNANDPLLPGGSADAAVVLDNPNQQLQVVSAGLGQESGGITPNDSGFDTNDCPASNVTAPQRNGLSIPVPTGSNPVVIPDLWQLAANAPTGCQNRPFTRTVRLTLSTP
jgi:hypothetical protein